MRWERRRHEVSATIAMLNSTAYWQKQIGQITEMMNNEISRLKTECAQWREVADMFAVAEHSYEKIMAFEAWEEMKSKHKGEQQ